MRRLLPILLILLSAVTVGGGAYWVTKQVCVQHYTRGADDLDWLRREFRLSDAEMAHIRQLHEGYLPKCRAMCDKIAAKKMELQDALDSSHGVSPVAEQKLAELAALRAQCQTQMLRHFDEVSQAMPPEQGRRYQAEMQRLTLGFHEQFETTMSASSHGHHQH